MGGIYQKSYDMKLLSAVAILVSFGTSFAVLELSRSLMATIYSAFASILLRVTKYPRNLSELTPMVHLVAFIFNLLVAIYVK